MCAKNFCKWTALVQLIIKNVVTCFLEHCVVFYVAVCVHSTRLSHIAPSLAPLMTSPLAQTGAGVPAPPAMLQSFEVSEADVLQVFRQNILIRYKEIQRTSRC